MGVVGTRAGTLMWRKASERIFPHRRQAGSTFAADVSSFKDGGPAREARIKRAPEPVARPAETSFSGDLGNSRIRRIDAATGVMRPAPAAGTGARRRRRPGG